MSSSRAVLRSVLVVCLAAPLAIGCGGNKKKISAAEGLKSLTADSTYKRGMELLAKRDLRQALSTLKRVQYTPDVREEIEPLVRLAMADATYFQNTALGWIDARSLYLDFVTLYGDHPLAPYAQVQAGSCSLKQVNHPSRDQAHTVQALQDLIEVERRYPNSKWVTASRALMRDARANLAESEFLVGKFYLKRKKYMAATRRFTEVVERFPDFPEMDKILYHLGQAMVLAGNSTEARIYLDKYLSDYPGGEYVVSARKALASVGGALETGLEPPSE